VKYIIVTAISPDELSSKVQEAIGKGWKPQGGMSTWTETLKENSITWDSTTFGQAMVKLEQIDTIGPQVPGPYQDSDL